MSEYLTILKSTGSYGNYVIHLNRTQSKYFWKKKDAVKFLQELKEVKPLGKIPVIEVSALVPTKNKYPNFFKL